jgi:hypothetical protein
VKFFNIDCHISVISDIKNIFNKLGHQVDHWSLSGHRWVFDFQKCNSPIINENNWKSIDENMVENFYRIHKKDLDKYDAFICCYPPIFLKLFEKFNRPIIIIAATRYDYPVIDDLYRLLWLEDSLNNNKNLILVANNEFDKKYCEKFLKKEWLHIPSLCDYTNEKHSKTKDQSVIFSKFQINSKHIHQSELGQYTWKELYSYEQIIHFPYNVSTMSIFEQYNAGIPLIFPSLEFSLELINSGIPLFSEIVFNNNNPNRQLNLFLNKEWLILSDFYNNIIECEYFESLNFKKTCIKPKQSNKEKIFNFWNNILLSLQ